MSLEEVWELHLQHKVERDKDTQMWAAVVEHQEQQCQTEMDVMSMIKPHDITEDLTVPVTDEEVRQRWKVYRLWQAEQLTHIGQLTIEDERASLGE